MTEGTGCWRKIRRRKVMQDKGKEGRGKVRGIYEERGGEKQWGKQRGRRGKEGYKWLAGQQAKKTEKSETVRESHQET